MPISVVIPAYNEEAGIAHTIDRLRHTLAQSTIKDWEIVVVDDGSSDGTGRVAEAAGVRVIRHLERLGYGRALKEGIAAAKHDNVAIADADGTYPIAALPVLFAKYQEGYHMVVGQRFGPEYRESMLKSPLRALLKWLVEFTAGRKIPDVNSGFRIFDRREAMQYFPRLCNTFSFTTSLTLAYLTHGRFIAYVPIDYAKRIGKSKVMLFRDTLRTIQYIVQAILYFNPIKIFIVLSGCALLFSGAGVALAALSGWSHPFWIGVAGVLVAFVLFGLGLVADLLRQIMLK